MFDKVTTSIKEIIRTTPAEKGIKEAFEKRVAEGALTREENILTHFGVFFAPYDPGAQEVFIGHHRKADLWIFNGGHIDQGELPAETLIREVQEEWGDGIQLAADYAPTLLTITEINNLTRQKCRRHYDIWYFIPLDKTSFRPDQSLLEKEFHQADWKTITETKKFVTDPNTLTALDRIQELFV